MTDIADELDSIVDDLSCLEDRLQLGCLTLVDKVLVEIKAGGSKKGTGIVMEVSRETLAFFFLEFYGGIEQYLLLLLLHLLQFVLVANYFSLVHHDKDDQA